MTKGAGFEEFYESGGGTSRFFIPFHLQLFPENLESGGLIPPHHIPAITPEEACPGIVKFIDNLELKDTGKFWAPNGAK